MPRSLAGMARSRATASPRPKRAVASGAAGSVPARKGTASRASEVSMAGLRGRGEGGPDLLARGHVPEPGVAVHAPSEDGLAVGAEARDAGRRPVLKGWSLRLARGGVPEADGLLQRAGRDGPAVGAEEAGQDRAL